MIAAYDGMKTSELVGVYNSLEPAKPLKNWKGSKAALIEKIEALRASLDVDALAAAVVEKNATAEEKGLIEETRKEAELWEQAEEAPVDGVIDTKPEADDTKDEAVEAAPAVQNSPEKPSRTIVAASMDLLCRVDYYENKDREIGDDNRVSKGHAKARSVGLTYSEIVRLIHEEFPGCETSPACLRWYSVKMRVGERGYEGHALPQRRPRSKPAKK